MENHHHHHPATGTGTDDATRTGTGTGPGTGTDDATRTGTGTGTGTGTDESAMAELLDLDAEVLHSYLSEVTAWIQELAAGLPPRRILDLGSGTGTGALALLQRFERADVIALDISAQLLHHLTGKAR